MAADNALPTSFSSGSDILLSKESGLLDGVGNEVWIGVLCILFFIWFSKYILDVYIFPENQVNNNDRTSDSNQGNLT